MISGDGHALPSPPTEPAGGIEDLPTAATPARRLADACAIVALVLLAVITTVPLGATRVFMWPWWIVFTATLSAPACALLLRAFDRRDPLRLPSAAWQVAGMGGVLTLVGSALASPYRQPSLQWSAPLLAAIAVFFVVFDLLNRPTAARPWRPHASDTTAGETNLAGGTPALPGAEPRGATLACDGNSPRARRVGWTVMAAFFLLVAIASLAEWLAPLGRDTLGQLIAARNPYPLGHANYTAGLSLLILPVAAALAWRERGGRRLAGGAGVLLGLAMLFSSGSRGGMIALAVVAALAILVSPLRRRTKVRIAVGAVVAAAVFVAANPRTRAMLLPRPADTPPNISNVQRSAMLVAGLRMGRDRPLLGWGPGTTPLAFPRYRAGLNGGAEDVLQLHDVPVALWAELGLAGLACAAAGVLLTMRDARRDLVAAVTLGGYAAFAVFDAQLDVPVFGFAIGALAAFVARPAAAPDSRRRAPWLGGVTLAAFAAVVLLGKSDPTPRLDALALSDQVGRAHPRRAIALLEHSLALNPDQEIAHFNLGWLQAVSSPAAAAAHFTAAAHLVPDKGGVYFGLGLARLNAGDRAGAARAFALEALNDPVFLLSPWWGNPALAALHPATLAALREMEARVARRLPPGSWAARELTYVRALNGWIAGELPPAAVAAAADTPERRAFFLRQPARARVLNLGTRTVRRNRLGYPVLMRDLDLAPPFDLWVVEESAARYTPLAYLWPDKGWLPSPLLIALLDAPAPANN